MSRAAKKQQEVQRTLKLERLLQHRHLQLRSPDMNLREVTTVTKKDKDLKAAFIQQDRTNRLFRDNPWLYAGAWAVASKTMPQTNASVYAAAMKKFLDNLEAGSGGATIPPMDQSTGMLPTPPESSRATVVSQSSRTTQPTIQPSRATMVRDPSMAPQATSKPRSQLSKATIVREPSTALQPASRPEPRLRRAMAGPGSRVKSQPTAQISRAVSVFQPRKAASVLGLAKAAPPLQPSVSKKRKAENVVMKDCDSKDASAFRSGRVTKPLQPSVTKKRKAEDVIMEDRDDQIMRVVEALRDGNSRARISTELSKYGLVMSLSHPVEQ